MIKQNINFIISLTFLCVFGYGQEAVNQFDESGLRHGKWTKNFEGTNQVRYQGQFEHGKEVGVFKFYQMVGKKSILAATKEFDENGIAHVTYLSLKKLPISEGKMNGKKYIGKWVYYHKNSKQPMTIENYNDEGILDGDKLVYYQNGQLAEKTTYREGKLEGPALYYSEDGTLAQEYIYVNDELHGPSKHYNAAGVIMVEGQYKRGKKTGVWKYYRNGELYEQKDFTYVPKFKKKQ